MAIKYFVFQALTGGAAGALDAISHTVLTDKDMAIGDDGAAQGFLYEYDADSVLAEDSPGVIAPDSGTGRWILQPMSTFAKSTVMLFGQSAAPTGWTKKVDWTNQSMIVYTTGNIAQGGAVDAKAAHQHAAFTLAAAEIPAHTHVQRVQNAVGGATVTPALQATSSTIQNANVTGSTGDGGSHQHTANSAPYYISVIACTKD